MTIRDTIIAAALDVQDYRAAVDEPAFRDLLGPPPRGSKWDLNVPFSCKKRPDGGYVTRGVSSCALVVSGVGRRAGMPWRWNGYSYWDWPDPYRGLDVMSSLSRCGQLTRSIVTRRPLPGDFFCIGTRGSPRN